MADASLIQYAYAQPYISVGLDTRGSTVWQVVSPRSGLTVDCSSGREALAMLRSFTPSTTHQSAPHDAGNANPDP